MKRSIYFLLVLTLSLSIVFSFSFMGCKEETPVEEAPAEEVTEPLEFVCVAKGIHPYFDPGGVGMEDAAAEIGNINTRYMAPAEWSGEAQTKMIEDLVAQGVDAIAVAVFEAGSMEPTINEAMKQGIPIVVCDDDVSDSERV